MLKDIVIKKYKTQQNTWLYHGKTLSLQSKRGVPNSWLRKYIQQI